MDAFPSENPFAKETDGFLARHFDRRLSGALSRRLLKTSVTPNQITVAVTLLGVVAGLCMAQPGYVAKGAGAALFLLTSILDGCDGEVARAKKMTSRLGGWLDLAGDNVVHMAVFYGMGLGLFRDTGNPAYATLGKAAAVGTLVAAALAGYQTYRKTKTLSSPTAPAAESLFTSVIGDARQLRGQPAWKKRLVTISDALARRDFVYGVFFLALIGRLEWFLWPCAIGVNVYAAVLLLLAVLL